MKLHVLVADLGTARAAVEGGATVVQWRLKDCPTTDIVERGRATRSLCARHGVTFVVNDDVDAALMLGADGVHLGRRDEGADRAREHGLLLGVSASGLEGLRDSCDRLSVPVVAIGGIDESNAAECIRTGAAGVAVIRAARDAAKLRTAIDAAL